MPPESELPKPFVGKMKLMLGDEAESFLASYDLPRAAALRLNPLKAADRAGEEWRTDLLRKLPAEWRLEPVPWCPDGYYYDLSTRPGKHPLHAAGMYYIQEPSAMSAVEWLNPQPGEAVLDLAASPGGKATQIAGRLNGSGLLIANEIHPARARILSENLERMGASQAIVTNETPERLAAVFPGFFDRIMLDAPCSGEGMFRKDPASRSEWSPEQVALCAARQLDILQHAVKMLKPGGVLAYSTCTFEMEENEQIMQQFTAHYPHMRLMRSKRIWPHRERGEGHYVAILQRLDSKDAAAGADLSAAGHPAPRLGGATAPSPGRVRRRMRPPQAQPVLASAMRRCRELMQLLVPRFTLGAGEPLLFGEQLYWLPHAGDCPFDSAWLRGLKVVRPGLHLGTLHKEWLEPAHSLAVAVRAEQARFVFPLKADDPATAAFLRGEALPIEQAAKGWMLVTVDDLPIGWGKASNGLLKNHYPKGLRRLN
jgi:16S rRNA C967 or C1407 C5-methylase (RsmB/RsmF family)/NOL1/NOP2/fmu family ribosome biogenesis protein